MSQTLSLYRLQQIDSQIDRIQTRLQAIQAILDGDMELRLATEKVHEAEIHFQSVDKTLKQAEAELQEQHIKIQQTESSLYGKSAHTPKELQDLQNDVAALKRHRSTLEDRLLEAMQVSETADTEHNLALVNLEKAQVQREAQIEKIKEEQNLQINDAERLTIERIAIAESISQIEIDLYEQLRRQRRGIAVAMISDKSCSACGSSLSAGQIQSAHSSSSILLCPSCGRILYGS